jgi:hypothetical protein
MTLHVPTFGGGVVTFGAPDQRQVNELSEADSFDIGPRGALICASDCTDYVVLNNGGAAPAPWTRLHALLSAVPGFDPGLVLAVGEGVGNLAAPPAEGPAYLVRAFARQGEGSPISVPYPLANAWVNPNVPELPSPEGVVVTGFMWPGVFPVAAGANQYNVAFFCLGAREGYAPKSNPMFGLWVAFVVVGTINFNATPIDRFDALGTGPIGEFAGGAKSQQLYCRGIIAYNNHAFAYGFDSADATNGDGPNRVMFSNLGLPLKWGNDNIAAVGTNRFFTDSDALVLGSAGEIIRGAIVWGGKLWFFTNQQGHYIAGFGRDSFLTDGATAAVRSYNIIGQRALIEGPDRKLYGVSDQGLWTTSNGDEYSPLFQKLRDFDGHSNGW